MNIFTTSDAICNCALLVPQAQHRGSKEELMLKRADRGF
jgi:hypothetical protein